MLRLLGNIVLTVAVVGGGYYLYKKYGNKHSELIGGTAGMILGDQLGYWVGSPYGKLGGIGGSLTGGIVGFYAGQKVARALNENTASQQC